MSSGTDSFRKCQKRWKHCEYAISSQSNEPNSRKRLFLRKKNHIFFWENLASSLLNLYHCLTSCKKLERSLEPFLRIWIAPREWRWMMILMENGPMKNVEVDRKQEGEYHALEVSIAEACFIFWLIARYYHNHSIAFTSRQWWETLSMLR